MPRTAVVIGASMGGMLAAAALARSVDEVIVLERDELPDEPRPRRGLPQGRHAHILLPSGRDAIDALVPGGGVRERLLAAGARERGLTSGLVTLGPQGWYRRPRHHDTHPLLIAGRDLIDRTVREAVLASTTRVSVRRASATGLLGTAERVTGVRFTAGGERGGGRAGAPEERLRADLVVDASGRGTRVEHWLADLGIAQALWVLEVERLGPFLVEGDRAGRSLFALANREIDRRLMEVYAGLPAYAMGRFGETVSRADEVV